MTRISYAAITIKKIIPSVTDKAPRAPECPQKLGISEVRLNIQYRKGSTNRSGVTFEREYVEHRITKEIESLMMADYQATLQMVADLFRSTLEILFPDSQCWLTGSYAAGVDIERSDLDFTVKVPSLNESNPFQKLLKMKGEFQQKSLFQRVWVQKGYVPVLQMKHKNVSIDVSIDNDSAKRNTQLLSWYGQMDSRFIMLCKVMKSWASSVGVEGASKARLNSFSLCLMLIHYLQVGAQPAVLPNLQEIFPELNGEFVVPNDRYHEGNLKEKVIEQGKFEFDENKESLATLYLGFLKYFAEFDFTENWISVKNGKLMKKRWTEDKEPMDGMPDNCYYIVVEDPFLDTRRNCAGTVRQTDYVERIQLEFQKEYNRISKNRTIFNRGPCTWSRRILENGIRRDYQIREVDIEKNVEFYEKLKEVPWGSPVPDNRKGVCPKPEEFWCLNERKERKYEEFEKWPSLISFIDYDFDDVF